MKRFTFTLQPYEQEVIVYFDYTPATVKRVAKKYELEAIVEGNAVYYSSKVKEITILIEKHMFKKNLIDTVAHEAFHVVQWMCHVYGLSTEDVESCAYLEGYIAKKIYEGCK